MKLDDESILKLYATFGEALADDIVEVIESEDSIEVVAEEELDSKEMVNHPEHYNSGGMETIEEMKMIFGIEATANFCLLNAWKYRARAPYKSNPAEDMEKANWYIAKYSELVNMCGGESK